MKIHYGILFIFLIVILLFGCTAKKQLIKISGTTFNGKVVNYIEKKGWKEESGNILTKITVDNDGSIYGITNYGNVVMIDEKGDWVQLSGDAKFRRVSAGNSNICGIASNGFVYLYDNENKEWKIILDKKASNIDLDVKGSAWIIDQNDNILYNEYNIDSSEYTSWGSVDAPDELLVDIAGDKDGQAWGVGENGTIYKYGYEINKSTGEKMGAKRWTIVGGEELRALDIDSNGTVWGINSDGNAVRYIANPSDKTKMIWEKFEVQLAEIAASGEAGI